MSLLQQLADQWLFAEAVARSSGRDGDRMEARRAWERYQVERDAAYRRQGIPDQGRAAA